MIEAATFKTRSTEITCFPIQSHGKRGIPQGGLYGLIQFQSRRHARSSPQRKVEHEAYPLCPRRQQGRAVIQLRLRHVTDTPERALMITIQKRGAQSKMTITKCEPWEADE